MISSYIKSPGKVMVAMSGGVDSSVAAALLCAKGYEVAGIMMRLTDSRIDLYGQISNFDQSLEKAGKVAEILNIPFQLIDLRKEFQEKVIEYFIESHGLGVTPNPCFICNRQIKWGILLDWVTHSGFQWLASGHYARLVRQKDGDVELFTALDSSKDQSYVLAGLTQHQLAHMALPLGEMTKKRTREIAHRYQFDFDETKESQDLCFLEGSDQIEFLHKLAPQLFTPGDIRRQDGEKIGEHTGLANYTIGQRKGLGAGQHEPIFVIRKEMATNTIFAGPIDQLGSRKIRINQLNWISGEEPELPARFDIKVRYKSRFLSGVIQKKEDLEYHILFDELVRDPTPGQFAVFYQGDKVIGSATISNSLNGVSE